MYNKIIVVTYDKAPKVETFSNLTNNSIINKEFPSCLNDGEKWFNELEPTLKKYIRRLNDKKVINIITVDVAEVDVWNKVKETAKKMDQDIPKDKDYEVIIGRYVTPIDEDSKDFYVLKMGTAKAKYID